ncbi:putative sensor-like histidine kinase [compost metagenome]
MFLVPLLIPVILLGSLSIFITNQYSQGELRRNNLVLFNQIDRSMEQLTKEVESFAVSLGNPDMLYQLETIMQNQALTLEDYRLMKTFQSMMNAPASVKPFIQSIYVYVNNTHGQFLASGAGMIPLDSFYDPFWKESYEQNKQQMGIWTEHRLVQRYSFEDPIPVTTLYKNLYPAIQNAPSGVIAINLNTSLIEKMLNNMTSYPGQLIMVLDENSRIVFSSHVTEGNEAQSANMLDLFTTIPESEGSLVRRMSGKSYLISQQHASAYDWRYLSINPQASVNRIPFRLSTFTGCIIVLAFGLGLALTFGLTRRNDRQVQSIITLLQHAEQGMPLQEASTAKGNDEFSMITAKIIKNFIEQHYLQIQLAEKKYRLQEAELLALQAQINPHFLFNTLQTIYWRVFALTGQPNEANRMVEILSNMLKYALEAPHELAPLLSEIRNAQHYIELQEIRYKDQFSVSWQYEHEELVGVSSVRLILQPLIENCIRHGLGHEGKSICIKVKIIRMPQYFRITVIDNGIGMSRMRLEEVRSQLLEEKEVYQNIGLVNTSKRIRLASNANTRLSIHSKKGWGTAVALEIPLPRDSML